jgi:hypothetical protein
MEGMQELKIGSAGRSQVREAGLQSTKVLLRGLDSYEYDTPMLI